jgi:small subunit ribosomal protein S5
MPKRDSSRRDKDQRKKREDDFQSKILALDRVTRVTGGGKKLRFRACIVIGDKKGKVGIGLAKGKDVSQAISKAEKVARKNIITVPISKDTIPHEVEAKFESSEVILKPQISGIGLIAGGPVRVICNLAGIENICAKILSRSRNKINNAMATMAALKKLKVEK